MPSSAPVRIFISSPSDVRPERLRAEQIVARLDREFAYHFRVEPLLWEREPLVATRHFQDSGNIPEPRGTDIVVVILWTRLGVPLPADRFRGAISGEPVTGTEWEFEDALAGARHSGRPDLLLYRKEVTLQADLSDRRALEEKLAQLDRVERFVGRWFRTEDGRGFSAASHGFSTATEFEEKLYDHLRALLQRRAGASPDGVEIRWHGPPFRGLAPFGPEHAQLFFGRTAARNGLRETVARLDARGRTFVLVLGASGSGKSSLVRAGLLPDLRLPGMVGRVALLREATMKPSDRPSDLVGGLATALLAPGALPELTGLAYDPARLAGILAGGPDGAALPVAQGLAAAASGAVLAETAEARLVLVLDQLEELFTAEGIDASARDAFASALDALVRTGRVWIVATLRSDFYDRLEAVPVLARLAEGERCVRLLPPDASERAQIVRRPAREAGLRFGVDAARGIALDDMILAAAHEGSALPLLSFLLDQLWQRRTAQGELTVEAYAALGGLEGALGRHAEAIFASRPPAEQAALPRLLRALVTVQASPRGSGLSVAARVAPLDRFAAGSPERALADAFLDPAARLLVAEDAAAPGEGPRLRVAHEALLTHWPRARDWIAERPADLQLEDRIEAEAARWAAADPADRASLLIPEGLRLIEAEDLARRRPDELGPAASAFVTASIAAAAARAAAARREAEERARLEREAAEAEAARLKGEARAARRLARRTILGLAVACLLAFAAAGFAWLSVERAAEARAATAEAETRLRDAQLKDSRFITEYADRRLGAQQPDAAELMARVALPADLAHPDRPYDPVALSVIGEARSVDRMLARLDHGAFVDSVALSADGARIATASRDGTAGIWDARTGAPIMALSGHGGWVVSARFDPAGRRVVTASADRTARLYDAETGETLHVLAGHAGALSSAAFDPGGTRVLTAAVDGTARIWDAATGAPLAVLAGPPGPVRAAWSPDGRLVATAGADGTLRLWDAASGAALRGLGEGEPPKGGVNAIAWSPDGLSLAAAGSDGTARIVDVASGAERQRLRSPAGPIATVRFSADGRTLLTASGAVAQTWDVASGRQTGVYAGHTSNLTDAVFSPDGARIFTTAADQRAFAFDRATGAAEILFEGHTGVVMGGVVTPDGQRFVTAGGDGTARIWDASGAPLAALLAGPHSAVDHAAFSPDGRRVAAGTTEGTVFVWDAASGAVLLRLAGHAGRVGRVAWSPDGTRLATGSNDHTARIWDVASGRETAVLAGHGDRIASVAWSQDGTRVLTASADGTARLWEAASGRMLLTLAGDKPLRDARFDPEGRRIATAGSDGEARLWDAATGTTLAVLSGHRGAIAAAAFSPDGRRLLTGSEDGTARLWDVASGTPLATLDGHDSGPIMAVAWSPDGGRILTSYAQSTSTLWDAASGQPLRGLRGNAAVFSPDGLRVATLYVPTLQRTVTPGDRTVVLLDAATGATLAEYAGHRQSINGLAFSPDGGRLVSYAWDGTARVWTAWPLLTLDTVAYSDLAALRGLTPAEQSALSIAPPGPPSPSPGETPAQACDRLAASADDPRRRAAPVASADLDVAAATTACRAASTADPKDLTALYGLGRARQRAGDYPGARQSFGAAAEGGYLAAIGALARLDHFGLGGPRDPAAALARYRQADAAGLPAAAFGIAQLYVAGAGVSRDLAEAVRWLQRAAERGSAPAEWALGLAAERGEGTARDLAAALHHYVVADRLIRAENALDDLDITPRRGAVARALPPAEALAIARAAAPATRSP